MADWWDLSWSHRGVVEFNQTYIDEAVPVVPVYLSGFDENWWTNVDVAGDDIRVTQEDGLTELDYYLVSIDTVLKVGLVIVNVDAYISASTNKKIYVYCGNASAAVGSDAAATFSDYAVFYLPGVTTTDLTGGGADLTAVNSPGTAASDFEGLTAATYNGTTQYHYDTVSAMGWPISVECIAYSTNLANNQDPFGLADDSDTKDIAALQMAGAASDANMSFFRGASGSLSASTSGTYSSSTWTYIAATRNANTGSAYTYKNGTAGSADSTILTTPSLTTIGVGGVRSGGALAAPLEGRVCFAGVSLEVRSADYFATMYDAWFTTAFRAYGPTDTAPTSNDTGWIPFTNTSQSPATAIWTSLSSAIGSLTDAALSQPDQDDLTYTLRAKNDGGLADVVSGTVTDLWYRVVGESDTGGSEQIDCTTARMVIGGSVSGNNFSGSHEFGARSLKEWKHSVDNFGTLPTAAQIQDGDNFGLDLQFTNSSGTSGTKNVRIYTVEFRVFFTPPSAGRPSGMMPIL